MLVWKSTSHHCFKKWKESTSVTRRTSAIDEEVNCLIIFTVTTFLDDRPKKPKDELKQVDGVEKRKPDKPKRNENKGEKPKRNEDAAKPDKPKRNDNFARPEKPQPKLDKPTRTDEFAMPATNGTAPPKKRGSCTKSKEYAEFGNVKPTLLTRDSKNPKGIFK